jgi:hypothetical protein
VPNLTYPLIENSAETKPKEPAQKNTWKPMKKLLLVLTLVLCVPAFAANMKCTTRPAKDTPQPQFASLAKIAPTQAEKTALAKVGAKYDNPTLKIQSSELEIEYGCLIYLFDFKVIGKRGVEEIFVDAGDGKVLSHLHDTPKQEAVERAEFN